MASRHISPSWADRKPVADTVPGLVAIQAEGNFVTLSFVREMPDPENKDQKYTTTWFDMFRIDNGKIAEHWDVATKRKSSRESRQNFHFFIGFAERETR